MIFLLSGCASIQQAASLNLSNQLEEVSLTNSHYPQATSKIETLVWQPPIVDLAYYQSVEKRPHQRPDVAIALAASGGGYRAANLTAGVLMGLEKIRYSGLKGNLLQEVDYFSSVSGGGFGVGTYLSSLHRHELQHRYLARPPLFSFNETIQAMVNSQQENMLRKDYRRRLFFEDNRGMEFEENLDRTILYTPNRSLLLGDIFISKADHMRTVQLPYWVTNAAIYQNAALFPFTPDVLARYQIRDYQAHYQTWPIKGTPNESNYAYDVPVAVGLAASASFPVALNTVPLKSDACKEGACYLQLVDGGLVDNLGIYSALNLLQQDRAKIKILIIVDAYKGVRQPFSLQPKPPDNLTLVRRVFGYSTDASRQLIKSSAQVTSKNLLCGYGAKNVLVVYLDLDDYPQAWTIETNLHISREQQDLLLNLGQTLVAKNPILNRALEKLLAGNQSVGNCQRYTHSRSRN